MTELEWLQQIADNMISSLDASLPVHVGGPLDGLPDWSRADVEADNEDEEQALLEGLRKIYEQQTGRKA